MAKYIEPQTNHVEEKEATGAAPGAARKDR